MSLGSQKPNKLLSKGQSWVLTNAALVSQAFSRAVLIQPRYVSFPSPCLKARLCFAMLPMLPCRYACFLEFGPSSRAKYPRCAGVAPQSVAAKRSLQPSYLSRKPGTMWTPSRPSTQNYGLAGLPDKRKNKCAEPETHVAP